MASKRVVNMKDQIESKISVRKTKLELKLKDRENNIIEKKQAREESEADPTDPAKKARILQLEENIRKNTQGIKKLEGEIKEFEEMAKKYN